MTDEVYAIRTGRGAAFQEATREGIAVTVDERTLKLRHRGRAKRLSDGAEVWVWPDGTIEPVRAMYQRFFAPAVRDTLGVGPNGVL